MAEPDDLFTLKNQLWVGNYETAISEASSLTHLSGGLKDECDIYKFRAYIALGQYDQVIGAVESQPNASIGLNAIKLYAMYRQTAANKEMVMLTLNEWISDHHVNENHHLLWVAGMIYGEEEHYSQAFTALTKGRTLEHQALMVQFYLKMHRLDMAKKQLSKMNAVDEDSTLSQLANAWISLHEDDDQCEEAGLHFQELSQRFGSSVLLLNGAMIAFLRLQNWDETERLLQEALRKEPNLHTLINSLVFYQHVPTKSKEESQQLVEQTLKKMEQLNPTCSWIQSYRQMEQTFDQLAQQYA